MSGHAEVQESNGRSWLLMVTPDGRAPGSATAPDEAALRHGWSCVEVVPLAVAEKLADALEEVQDDLRGVDLQRLDGWGPVAHGLQVIEGALARFRAAHPARGDDVR